MSFCFAFSCQEIKRGGEKRGGGLGVSVVRYNKN